MDDCEGNRKRRDGREKMEKDGKKVEKKKWDLGRVREQGKGGEIHM